MRSLRVVIVDDNEDSCEVLELFLSRAGHEVVVAQDGAEGASLIESTLPDLAVIDISLPSISGYEVAQRVRAASIRQPYLVALTGHGRSQDRELAMSSGFDEHLVKPLHLHHLDSVIARARAATQST